MTSSAVGPQPISEQDIQKQLASFDSMPLFMKSLPTDDSDDSTLSALQSLIYEGKPDEVAKNFKDEGNEYFKGKRYREALGFYTQGIDAKPEDPKIQEVLLCNRAACNLELKNYGSVLKDCSKALNLNSTCSKAFYRSAMALMGLGRVEEAIDCCERCLAYDSNNEGVITLLEKARKVKSEKDKREADRLERIRREEEAMGLMKAAFRERNLIDIPNPTGSVNPYSPHWDTTDSIQPILILPVFFLYPQYATSDVIAEFAEDTPFAAHISTMFPPKAQPPEWDAKGEYRDGQLVIYAMTHRKRLLKVGKRMSLRDVCRAAKAKDGDPRDGLEVKDGCLSFVVMPKGDVEKKWVDEFKSTRDQA